MSVELTFHGAVSTTTGSMHIVSANGRRVLLECGLYQGKRKEAFERNRNIPFDVESIDAMVLSHAHIDHSGNIPTLVKRGFRGKIYTTPATRDLCEIMLLDSAHIQVKDVMYVNKRRIRQGKNPFEPLYVREDVVEAMKRFQPLSYGKRTEVADGILVTFFDAAHLLGSALTMLEVEGKRILFTGDLGRRNMPILRNPSSVPTPDVLITESTYGGRFHPPVDDVKSELRELVQSITERGSRLVIPAFSVGRTQTIICLLHELYNEGAIPEASVFVDSPLSSRATAVYENHPECFDMNTWAYLVRGEEPFTFKGVEYIVDVEESKELNRRRGAMIIISASGMCESGRILHHLAHSIGNPDNYILLVGFQAENTLGRKLREGVNPVRIFGEPFDVRAEVRSIDALSSHADTAELLDYVRTVNSGIKETFLVHGEEERREALAEELRKVCSGEIILPKTGESFRVE